MMLGPLFRALILIWTLTFSAFGKDSQGIPTSYMNDPAVDLVYKGQLLLPDQADKLISESKGRFDISTLNPEEKSDLWKNVYVEELPEDKNPLGDMDEVSYNSPVLSPTGIFRFNIQNKLGDGKLYTMMISANVHSILLAKSLLRKIGYQIPDIKYLPRIVIKFKDEMEKAGFKSYLTDVAFTGDPKSWIVEELDDNKLLLQDLIIMEANHPIYNLAVGATEDMIQGRRLLSSLAVPMAIVNLQESVNMLRWNVGVEENKVIKLYLDNADDYQCSWDDARWISRRIEKLKNKDWEDVVASSNIPKTAQLLLLEKIKSRRNSAMKLFKIDARKLDVKRPEDLNDGVDLVDGKLTKQDWPGYGSRFAFGDPESPLSDSDLKSFIKSKTISTLIEAGISQLNQLSFMSTDIDAMNEEKFRPILEEAIKTSTANHTPVEIPVSSWVYPTYQGQVILSRNLVTGTYLGTDNLVQLVDTVGASVGGGAFGAVVGLPVTVAFGAQGQLMRTYSHLRPVMSIKQSLKYPFKNLFVPLVKTDYGRLLHEASMVVVKPNATSDERKAVITKALAPLKNALSVGESLIVTDTIAAGTKAQIGIGYKKLLEASLGIVAGYTVVSRFHVTRKSENEFQIYKDLGNVGSYGIGFGLNSLVPVLDVTLLSKKDGRAKIKFYSLSLNSTHPKVIENMSILRSAIVHSSTRRLDENEESRPFILKHSFKESTPAFDFLIWQWQKVRSFTDMEISSPKGEKRYYKRTYYGTTKGKNYQAYATSMISHWVDLLFDKEAGISSGTGTNPGYSYKGSAKTKFLTLDQEVNKDGTLIEPFIKISKIYNGWSINRKRAEEILDEMTNKYRFEFVTAPVLNDTRNIFLYNISLNIMIYQEGINRLVNLTEVEIKEIFKKFHSYKNLQINPAVYEEDGTKVGRFLRLFKRYKRYVKKENEEKANRMLLKALYLAEDELNLSGLAALAGGIDNIYATSFISGFREGDEDGDKAIRPNTLGEIGSPRQLGPIVDMQLKTRMLEGEFFIYWLMTRLI